jgi:ribosome-associated protein
MTQNPNDRVQQLVIQALEDLKAEKINYIDVAGVANFTDRMIFASGNSNRHVKSIARSVLDMAKEQGLSILGVEGEDSGDWVLIDLGDVVVHIMLPDTREFYDIERLWSDQTGQSRHTG